MASTQGPLTFGALLRKLRTGAGLTQEELAGAASLSPRSVSDLERGINLTARKDTARLLADALNLTGLARAEFEAVARGRAPADGFTAAGVAAAVRTLPRDIASFTGREPELRDLMSAAAERGGFGGAVDIYAIGGMAGVGKTAFTVHAAHLLAAQFPAGQVFLPLHGHTPGQRPVSPADALASLLLTVGIPTAQIPPDTEARTALWRHWLADKELLLVLDDAVDSDQVRPLLPGTGASLVLVTSRRHLTALEDATAISLGTLPAEEAAALLVRLAARPGLEPGEESVGEIARLCGYLPLAIGMLARQLHHHPSWTPADLAADLTGARDRLELMVTENLSVAAAFELSYQDLGEAQRRLFRHLGLHPGVDIDAFAAAALDGTDLATARRHLQNLYDQYLLTEAARGRYRLHDLIREHARALAVRDGPGGAQAAGRLLDYYQHTAAMADRHMTRYTRPGAAPADAAPAVAGPLADVPALAAPLAGAPAVGTRTEALAWLRAERPNLMACIDYAIAYAEHDRAVGLTAALAAFLRLEGPWTQPAALHRSVIGIAQGSGNRLAEANSRCDLADVRFMSGDYAAAAELAGEALGLYREVGQGLGEANARWILGRVRYSAGDPAAAAELLEAALELYREVPDLRGQANALHELGRMRYLAGDNLAAAGLQEQALELYRDLGDLLGEAHVLNDLGCVRYETADYVTAIGLQDQALALYRDLGYRLGQANALHELGRLRYKTGDYGGATDLQQQALELYRDLGSRLGEANILWELGLVRHAVTDYAAAGDLLAESLALCRELGYRLGEANALHSLGRVRHATGDQAAAAGLLAESLTGYHDVGDPLGEAEVLNSTGDLLADGGQREEALAAYLRALLLARQVHSQLEEARALEGTARCRARLGEREAALADLRAAVAIYQRIGAAEASSAQARLTELESARAQH
jgi:tetratricopeptide (TPR) repeat protein/transcriptional regulator with XRE-family HTH domain